MPILNQFAIIFWKNWKIFKNNPLSIVFYLLEVYIAIVIISILALREGKRYEFPEEGKTDLQNVYSYNSFTNKNPSADTIYFVLPNNQSTISGEEFVNRFKNDPNIIKIIKESTSMSTDNFKFITLPSENDLWYLNKLDKNNKIIAGVVFGQDYTDYTIRIKGNKIVDSDEPPISNYAESRRSEYGEDDRKINRIDFAAFYSNVETDIPDLHNYILLKNKILYYMGKTKADTYINTFIPIQIAIDNIIIQLKTNETVKGYSADIGKLSKPPIDYQINNEDNRKVSFSGYAVCIYMIFTGQIFSIMNQFMKEKESGIHDGLISVGANRIALWMTWIVIYLPFSIFTIIIILIADSAALFGKEGSINYFLYFVYLILYAFSVFEMTICSCLVIRKTKPLMLIISITFFTVFAVNEYVYKLKISKYAYIEKIISLIFPPIGVSMASSIITYENNRNGYIGLINGVFKNEFGVYFLFMVIDVILYFILAVMIEYNSNWRFMPLRLSQSIENTEDSFALDIQEDPIGAECFVQVRNIHKYFKFKKNYVTTSDNNDGKIGKIFTANHNINFNVYKDEIFGILGHNGAGKSTLIQIMIGMIKPDSGECFYHGLPLSQNKKTCQHHMGICLQNNILIEGFTVVDHFIIYCNVKEVMDDLDTWLEDIDLVEKRDCEVQYLSTGQKRKLCIGLAFLGNPKYVFLDEPTTGLDPVSRQKIWSLLLKKKKDRVIFIATHYMDEADIIADRKLILNKGTVRCLGSSMYLKNHFQMQYNLEVETNKPRLVENIVKYYIPEAEYFNDKTKIDGHQSLPRNMISSHIWKLSIDSSPLFSYLIKKLEEEKRKGDILRNFSVSAPRLEELFVYLAKENEANNENEYQNNSQPSETSIKNAIELPSNTIQKPNDVNRALRILHYRLKFNYRKKLYLGIAFVLPFIIYAIFFTHLKIKINNQNFTTFKEINLSASEMYPNQQWNYDVSNSTSLSNVLSPQLFQELPSSYHLKLSNHTDMSEIGKLVTQEPYYVSSFSGKIFNNNNNNTLYHFYIFYNDSMPYALPTTFNSLSNAILSHHLPGKNETIQVHSYPLPFFDLEFLSNYKFYIGLIYSLGLSLMLSYCGFNIVYEKKNNLLKQLQLNGISNFSYWLSMFLSDYIWFILSGVVVILSIVIFKFEPLNNVYILIYISIFLLICGIPCIFYQYLFTQIFTNENVAFATYFFINIFPTFFITYTMDGLEIYDDISNSSEMYYCLIIIFIDILLPCFNFTEAIKNLFTMGVENIAMGIPFKLDSLFSIHNHLLIHIVGAVFSILFYIFVLSRIMKKLYTPNYNDVYPIPKELEEKIEKEMREGDEDVYYEYERVKEDKKVNAIPIKLVNLLKEYNDIGIISHEEFRNAMKRNESLYGKYHLSRTGIRRIVTTAFENINLGIDPCECFGILGPNGSGKTSLLNTVSFTFNQTSGEIIFNGKSTLERKANEIRLGYCPQENTLWNEMTLYEHIEMFLYIRGCTRSKSRSLAKQFIKYCRLTSHKNKFPTEMSGGTRRKLNILIALCCDSSHVLLDEPSAGMDPATRRYIWDVIKATLQRNQSSIIMTTHSMEEAELLCNRIGIMVNGKLQCIGTPEHLRMKFGHTYILDVHTENVERFHREIVVGLSLFGPDAQFKRNDKSQQRVKYEIQNTNTDDIGRVFEIMEACRDVNVEGQKLFIDYSYSQTTLEEVFFNFARLKENYDSNEDSIGDSPII